MAYLSVRDHLFDRPVSLRQAYEILAGFIEQYHRRGESTTLALVADTGLGPDGSSCDLAQLYDFVRVAGQVLQDDELSSAAGPA